MAATLPVVDEQGRFRVNLPLDMLPAVVTLKCFVCFNPWLEARFPDGGMGGGTVSNCQSCHRRASYPAVAFLPVTRGAPDRHLDPAYRGGQLRTNFLWALARHAQPEHPKLSIH